MDSTVETLRKPPEAYDASDAKTRRQTESAVVLLAWSVGGPRAIAGKLARLARTIAILCSRREVGRRLARLVEVGLVERIPTRTQRLVLGLDMLRFFIEPGARDYYRSRGVAFGLHQVLRVLDDPVSMIDPVGVVSDRDTIIGHVLQVVHANPRYDLELLEMFEDGLAELESQTAAMIAGTHPRAGTIGAIVEDPEYHTRLLAYVRRYRRDRDTPELRRRALGAREDPWFVLAEETFGALSSAFRYACRLPTSPREALRHLRTAKHVDPRCCDADVVARVTREFGGLPS